MDEHCRTAGCEASGLPVAAPRHRPHAHSSDTDYLLGSGARRKSWGCKLRLQLGSHPLFLSMQPRVGQSWPVAAGPKPKIHYLQSQNSQPTLWSDVGKLCWALTSASCPLGTKLCCHPESPSKLKPQSQKTWLSYMA